MQSARSWNSTTATHLNGQAREVTRTWKTKGSHQSKQKNKSAQLAGPTFSQHFPTHYIQLDPIYYAQNCTFFWIFQIYTTKFWLFVFIYFGTLYFVQHVMESCHFPIKDTAILKQNGNFLLSPRYFFYLIGQKYSRIRRLLRVKGLVICFYFD